MLNEVEWSDISLKSSTDAASFHVYSWTSPTHTISHTHTNTIYKSTPLFWLVFVSVLGHFLTWFIFLCTVLKCFVFESSGRNQYLWAAEIMVCCYWHNPHTFHGELLFLNTLVGPCPPSPQPPLAAVLPLCRKHYCFHVQINFQYLNVGNMLCYFYGLSNELALIRRIYNLLMWFKCFCAQWESCCHCCVTVWFKKYTVMEITNWICYSVNANVIVFFI